MNNLTPVFQLFIGLIAAIMTAVVIPWIQKKLSIEKQVELAGWVEIAVAAAEQLYAGSGRGEEKKAYVLEFLAEKGYTVDTDALLASVNALIEAAVYQLKNG